MFPDCPAQPANILRAVYTFPGQREEATAGTSVKSSPQRSCCSRRGSPGPAEILSSRARLPDPSASQEESKEAISLFPFGSDWRTCSSSRLRLWSRTAAVRILCPRWPERRKFRHAWLGRRGPLRRAPHPLFFPRDELE